MGYYVSTTEVNFFLAKEHFNSVYQKMCELNNYDDLKRGGSYGANTDPVEGDKYPRNKWFSWMSPNYPDTCKDMFEILQELGFEWELDQEGNITRIEYPYNKTGSEEYFLCCFAGYAKDGSYLEFRGEEGDTYWRYVFTNGVMFRQDGEISINYNHAEVYEFGKPTQADIDFIEWKKNFDKVMKAEKANG
jgi:hypothetical protein